MVLSGSGMKPGPKGKPGSKALIEADALEVKAPLWGLVRELVDADSFFPARLTKDCLAQRGWIFLVRCLALTIPWSLFAWASFPAWATRIPSPISWLIWVSLGFALVQFPSGIPTFLRAYEDPEASGSPLLQESLAVMAKSWMALALQFPLFVLVLSITGSLAQNPFLRPSLALAFSLVNLGLALFWPWTMAQTVTAVAIEKLPPPEAAWLGLVRALGWVGSLPQFVLTWIRTLGRRGMPPGRSHLLKYGLGYALSAASGPILALFTVYQLPRILAEVSLPLAFLRLGFVSFTSAGVLAGVFLADHFVGMWTFHALAEVGTQKGSLPSRARPRLGRAVDQFEHPPALPPKDPRP